MITAAEILDAVKRGGSNNWLPRCELNQRDKAIKSEKKAILEKNLEDILKFMKDKRFTVNELARAMDITQDASRHRLETLRRKGLIKRSEKMPAKYWKL